jgi:hypothetical protein
MRFEEIQPGTYRSKVRDDVYVWVTQQGPNHWWWSLGSATGAHEWGTDFNGPFPDMWGAVADAVARYEWVERADVAWWVYRPTYMGQLQSPRLWRIELVEAGSERDRMLTSRRTVTDAGEVVEIPGQWIRFTDRTEAEEWMRSEAERWERWNEWNSLNY